MVLRPFMQTEKALQRTRDGWFGRITHLLERATVDDVLWEELEELLISADVGVATAERLIGHMRLESRKERLFDAGKIRSALKQEMVEMLNLSDDSASRLHKNVPLIITVVGINGSGKTTSIAKMAQYFKREGKSVLLAAGDTFRAAAIDQLQLWAQIVGVDVVAHSPGGDPAAVVFDALQASMSRNIDVLIVDTAGRLHTKHNLMEELKKIKRVAARFDSRTLETVLMLDATTGQNGLAQARQFAEAVEVTGVFLSKLDGTAKGGIVLAICDQLNLPVMFVGTGESLDDIAPFSADIFVDALLK